jgi:hypothetical protein
LILASLQTPPWFENSSRGLRPVPEPVSVSKYHQSWPCIFYTSNLLKWAVTDLARFLNNQMNVSTAEELIDVINERSIGVDLDGDEVNELFDMIKSIKE